MIEINETIKERAILVSLNSKNLSDDIIDEHLTELEELADTAGADAIIKIVQKKNSIDSAYHIGKGKAEELKSLVELNDINLVIFDDDLSPVQVRNLEKLIDKKILDRSGLILDIFAARAKTKEAKTQVELAQLQYLLPRLTRAWTHLSKQYGGIGTKGPGETQIETDRRMIRNRISHLKENLKKIESQRETQSSGRKDYLRVCLVGYTNVGKSTLFNLVTGSEVFAENKLFATLDSTTRSVELDKSKLLISDTVGFIRKLPHHLVASFKSTLNEVREADLILHVVDLSHQYYEDQIEIVKNTMKDLGADTKETIYVFNKVDLIKDKNIIDYVRNKYPESVIVSAARGINISSLSEKIMAAAQSSFIEDKVELDITDSRTAARIHNLAEVISTSYDDTAIRITYRANKQISDKIKKMVNGH